MPSPWPIWTYSYNVTVPKRHHYVPEVILKRFTDDDGWLHLFSSRDRRVRPTRVSNAFCEGHLYSEERADGTKDPKVEFELSWLEGAIEPILAKFESAALSGKNPELTDAELLTWRFYMVVQWRRVPDLHKTVATDEESAAYLHEILDDAQAKFPDRADEIEAMRCPNSVRRTVKNARVSGVTEVSGRAMSAMASREELRSWRLRHPRRH